MAEVLPRPIDSLGEHIFMTICSTVRVAFCALVFLTCESITIDAALCTESSISFSRDVKPILAARCFSCHGPDVAESSLALHERDLAIKAADSGSAAIVPGDPKASELVLRIAAIDEFERMPPEGDPLTEREISVLREWISEGAKYQKHWAFVRPIRRNPPPVDDGSWPANPIDAFILAQLEENDLLPSPPAEKQVLARRVYYDVTGLPPTPEEMEDFLRDERPDAYEHLVDRLLSSTRYGETWARHWLDIVRYAESNSFERDAPKPYVWKYRDYVIRSLNEDKPYDQFVREQLAGDELRELTEDSITATGYYRLGTWDDEPADQLQSKYDDLDNIVSTTGQAFLGLTIGCARCHDHKIDPVSQSDYYSFLAFFGDVTPYALPHKRDAKFNSLWDVSDPLQAQQREELRSRQTELRRKKLKLEDDAVRKMHSTDQARIESGEREEVLREKLQEFLSSAEFEEYRKLNAKLGDLSRDLAALPPANWVLSLARCDPNPETMHVMLRGNPHVLGDPVDPSFPEIFGDAAPDLPLPASNARSANRRRVLAEWITSPDNMLTGRVIANRVWQHHFGRGIVRSANNFGQLGTPPTHPELLDWLAHYLIDHQWRLKPLHRLILTSNTYRMSSRRSSPGLLTDPENDMFWRFNMRRLRAEEIRDSVLHVTGTLEEKLYGPSIYPKLSKEVLATQSRPGDNWKTSKPQDSNRRSIYIHIKRSLVVPELTVFDFPDTDTSCEARFDTVQAAQALSLLHSDFMQTQAKHFADRVIREGGDTLDSRLAYALRLALSREPDMETLSDGLQLFGHYRQQHDCSQTEALQQFCLMVLNLNEFIYID